MKEGKDEREAISVGIKVKVGARVEEQVRNQQLQTESNQQQIEELANSNNDLKQRKRNNNKWQSMDQTKNILDTDIEEIWQLMMKQSIWRKMIATRSMINQNLDLIEKERKMKHKIADIQQQQGCRAFRQLQTKVWDPEGFLTTNEDT